jgi:cytochrome P450
VLIKSASNFTKDLFLRELRRILGEGLLTAEGAFWKRQRRLIQPAFHRERIAGYGAVMVDHTERMLATWRDGATIDLHHEMMSVTADIVTQCLFGTNAGDTREVSSCIEAMMQRFNDPIVLLVPGVEYLPLPVNREFRRVAPRLDKIVRGFVAERRAMGDPAPGDDLLAMLLNARDEDGSRMDDRTVRDEVLILFLAGHETTALALSWAFCLLAENPEVERKLHAELAEALGDRAPCFEDVPKLKYTECVVHETLRLRPPAWALGREATAPFELASHRFENGAWFWILPWTLHRDPRHFPDPERFAPERWEDGLMKRLPRCAYLPFGAGPRVCIGNQFALMEAVLMLATLARRFSVRIEEGFRVEPEPSITLRFKHGLRARLHARPGLMGATPP